ncbi:MAG: hypothetical protein FLDDKLPJ_03633 [Phycisphaerae bacterium]|nr:hypothetical protein [Phycisphaerae bacterium]
MKAVRALARARLRIIALLLAVVPGTTPAATGGGGGCGEQGAFCPEGPVGVYEQYTYEPYGQPSSVDKFITTPPQNTVGHQGLIFDRYCGNSIEDPCITTTQKGLYLNRNRYYHARLGRFTTPDPNASALPLIEGVAYHAMSPSALAAVSSSSLSQYSPSDQFGDSMNLYTYLANQPVNNLDPTGRFAIGTFGDLLGSTAVRTGLTALDAGGKVAMMLDTYSAIAGGMNWRNALTDLVIGAAYDRIGGKAFDAALDAAVYGIRKLSSALSKGIRKGLGQEVAARGFAPPRGFCFVEGTLVLTSNGYVPIECLAVGDRVLTADFPYTSEPDDTALTAVDPKAWVHISLRMHNPDGSMDIISIETLQSEEQSKALECTIGGCVSYSLDEMGLQGTAFVYDIKPCPPIPCEPGRVVLSTVSHLNGHVLRFWFDTGLPLELTETHRLYSEDRNAWVQAVALRPGDCIRTRDGSIQVVNVEPVSGVYRVYNIQVETERCYYVSEHQILSHNMDQCSQPLTGAGYETRIRGLWGGDGPFNVGGREFDGAINNIWFELKGSAVGFKDWENLRNQLGSQVAIARQNGHEFMLVTSGDIPSDFAAWLSSKGIGHVVQP